MNEHLKILGHKVRDVVTGFEGVVSSVSFDLYGCVQGIVTPEHDAKKKPDEDSLGRWFDTKRLKVLSSKPVMAVPTFDTVPGGQNLPGYPSQPSR